MGYMFGFFLVLLLVSGTIALLLTVPAGRLAGAIRMTLPAICLAAGAGLMLLGRMALGVPLILFGLTLWGRNRGVGNASTGGGGQKSTVRSAMFDMELDHDTGDLDGVVLTGEYEGQWLSSLDESNLMQLYTTTSQDSESAALLEAYLDRRIPGWRENAEADMGSGHGGPASPGPMTKEEAYQILGLAPGAGPEDIRQAHRRLMKRAHPDSGGSTFLASKINEAKDVLLS